MDTLWYDLCQPGYTKGWEHYDWRSSLSLDDNIYTFCMCRHVYGYLYICVCVLVCVRSRLCMCLCLCERLCERACLEIVYLSIYSDKFVELCLLLCLIIFIMDPLSVTILPIYRCIKVVLIHTLSIFSFSDEFKINN